MANEIYQQLPNSCQPEDDPLLTPYPEPEILESNPDELSVIDVIPEESIAVAESLPPEEDPRSQSSYATAPERTLQSIAPKSDRPPFAVRIHQTSERAGKDTILTAHVGVEDYSAMESRPRYDAVLVRRGNGPRARIVSAGVHDHENQVAYVLPRREVSNERAVEEELLVSGGDVPDPIIVVRAMIRGPEEVRRLETEVEETSSPLIEGCCALCGECVG